MKSKLVLMFYVSLKALSDVFWMPSKTSKEASMSKHGELLFLVVTYKGQLSRLLIKNSCRLTLALSKPPINTTISSLQPCCAVIWRVPIGLDANLQVNKLMSSIWFKIVTFCRCKIVVCAGGFLVTRLPYFCKTNISFEG